MTESNWWAHSDPKLSFDYWRRSNIYVNKQPINAFTYLFWQLYHLCMHHSSLRKVNHLLSCYGILVKSIVNHNLRSDEYDFCANADEFRKRKQSYAHFYIESIRTNITYTFAIFVYKHIEMLTFNTQSPIFCCIIRKQFCTFIVPFLVKLHRTTFKSRAYMPKTNHSMTSNENNSNEKKRQWKITIDKTEKIDVNINNIRQLGLCLCLWDRGRYCDEFKFVWLKRSILIGTMKRLEMIVLPVSKWHISYMRSWFKLFPNFETDKCIFFWIIFNTFLSDWFGIWNITINHCSSWTIGIFLLLTLLIPLKYLS